MIMTRKKFDEKIREAVFQSEQKQYEAQRFNDLCNDVYNLKQKLIEVKYELESLKKGKINVNVR